MRKPARQHPPNKAEELAVRTDPDRRLTDRQRNQLRVARQRRPPPPGRDRVLISEHIRCNNKGFQIRHLELQSRGDTGLEALLRSAAGPCQPTRLSHQASSSWRGSGVRTLAQARVLLHRGSPRRLGEALLTTATTPARSEGRSPKLRRDRRRGCRRGTRVSEGKVTSLPEE